MSQLAYTRLAIVTLAVDELGEVSIASPATGVTIDVNGAITWDVSAAPVYTGMAGLVTVYRNGVAFPPTALDADDLTAVILAAPSADYAYVDGEQLWGVYPSGVADEVTLGAGQAGRRLLDRDEARARLVRYCQPAVEPTLTDEEVDALLDENTIATVWAAGTAYQQGDMVVPTAPNGLVYTPARNSGNTTYGGTSGTEEPDWPLNLRWPGGRWDGFYLDNFPADRKEVEDGTLRWAIAGVEGAALWDIRRAAHEAWVMKAAKASGEYATSVNGASFHPEQVVAHCERMAERFRPMGIA